MDDILQEQARRLHQRQQQEQPHHDDSVVDVDEVGTVGETASAVTTSDDAKAVSIFTEEDCTPNWEDYKSPFYSPATREKLGQVRKSQFVEEAAVRRYLQDILRDLTAAMPLDEGIQRLRQMHEKLIFRNPLHERDNCEGKLQLSMPPGIENLGATCYLNTQLQCLAQNRVFVEGIVSWRAPAHFTDSDGKNDRMNSVLSLFQDLLVRLNAGSTATLNTLNFSNALGLDHFEQQDPNEFSRLFLDKMHESFQQTAVPGGRSDLSELLPHLFRGVLKYETTCLKCKNKSGRTEDFMDLNLPIVHPSDADKDHIKSGGQTSILEFVTATKRDTDLQFCLDQCCHPEKLNGDNQYYCSMCECKVDAERALTFQKLPPVLNVQLSRYVFDRKTFMKKKLSDKVLLPLDLSVLARSEERKQGMVRHRYLLCAVMRHKGTSAYSGHYVGEAMDWLTGQWFEFNDEKVAWLEDGPSNSIDLTTLSVGMTTSIIGGKKRKSTTSTARPGSQDAYNMYYVEEAFLAQTALDGLRKLGQPTPADGEEIGIVEKIARDRSEFCTELAQ